MDLKDIIDLFQTISQGTRNVPARAIFKRLRAQYLHQNIKPALIKVAFDTRRINQETEYNPRRGLQNYHRSQQFVSENMAQKISNFNKLRQVLEGIRTKYEREPEWQDSYARVLLSTLNKGLRVGQQDGDFTDNQPGVGSLDYIEELLHVRYRLGFDQLTSLGEKELEGIILSRDENIINKNINQTMMSKNNAHNNYGGLLEILQEVRATSDNPEVERSITITVKDRIINGR